VQYFVTDGTTLLDNAKRCGKSFLGLLCTIQPLTMDDYGFSQNAVKTVKTWQFQPATCNGRAVAAEMTIEVDFR
jgi:hypothetical protein